ncbi:TetR/AcrR family transcriptional regulator [Nocardia mexicana]|uniref:TetR family transcriptional regulator n=1 Tax=Nocardia mexicana TaxID=279262 RepID=A0A370H0S8_9NOCA|nr:TetR/AcrR family transcriptional regulator [Nocardia mexicana]RDI49645.1 TetR family transcriptional regulator [Nocardia mexicana]
MTPTRTRLTASERSEQVLDAAVTAFAESGYAATKTDEIARLAGVSQPYVIRLFGSKRQLFLATAHRVCDRVEEIFRASRAEAAPDVSPQEALDALGEGYNTFVTDRDLLLVLLHAFAASSDPAIGDDVRDRFGRIHQLARELTGASPIEVRRFMATGMLITVMSALQVIGPGAISLPWAEEMIDSLGDD